jgi:hypothetical protein
MKNFWMFCCFISLTLANPIQEEVAANVTHEEEHGAGESIAHTFLQL